MKKEECLKIIDRQKEQIELQRQEIDSLTRKLYDYDNLQHINIELQGRLLHAERSARENEHSIRHLQHELEIYETTFKALAGDKYE